MKMELKQIDDVKKPKKKLDLCLFLIVILAAAHILGRCYCVDTPDLSRDP